VLSRDSSDGASLKSAIIARLTAAQMFLQDTIAKTTGETDRISDRDADLKIETSIVDLMNAYAHRATTAQTVVGGYFGTLADTLSISDAATQIDTKLKAD